MYGVELSVVVGTFNRLPLLQKCLDALISGIHVDCEIIVIDAGSTDGTLEYVGNLQDIRLVADKELIGQARSLNRVMLGLGSKYVCWLSDDNILIDGMIDEAVNILDQNHDIGLVALKVKDVTGHAVDRPYIGGTWVSGILNCNQGVLPAVLFQKLGGFDEEIRDYGIDADLTTRVLLEGYRVVLTKRIAIHHYRDHNKPNWTDSKGRKERGQKAKEIYNRKHSALIEMKDGMEYDRDERLRSKTLYLIRHFYSWAGALSLPIEKLVRIDYLDWQNLFLGRFISRFDFIENIFHPYYLVQKMPQQMISKLSVQSKE